MSGFLNNDLPAASGEPAGSPHPVSPLTDQGEAPVALGVSMSGSYVKFYRKWLDSEIAREPTTSHLFTHLLLRAARFPKEREMYGYTLAVGECDETQQQLAVASGLSRQQVRTCYKKMTRAGMISTRTISHGGNRQRVITKVVNYELYQCPDDGNNHGSNHVGNTGNNQRATSEQPVLKKVEKDKKEEKTTLPADKPPKSRKPHWSEPAGSRLAKLTGCPKSGPWSFLGKLAREQTEAAVMDALARFPWDRALNWKHAAGWITEAAKSIHATTPTNDDYEDRLD